MYGAAGNKWFLFFNIDIASAITSAGQLSIRWIEKEINKWLNEKVLKNDEFHDYVIAIDTDSIVVEMGDIVEQVFGERFPEDKQKVTDFLDKLASEKVEPFMSDAYQKLANVTNAKENAMEMERENIADRAVWSARKRYIMNLFDAEGVRYEVPEQKIMGMDAIRSNIPEPCRNKLKECYRIILQGNENDLIEAVADFKEKWFEFPIEEIAFNSSINGLSKYHDPEEVYIKGAPNHVKGALNFNNFIKQNGMDSKYPKIQEGEKIKFVYMKKPNPIFDTVLAFPGFFPYDGDVEHYVDRELMWEKAFVKPLVNILEAIDWDYERQASLEDFFS